MEENKKFDVREPKRKNKSFWVKAKESIINFEKYVELMNDKVGSTIKYIFQIMLIFTLILTCVSVYKFANNFNKAEKIIKNDCKEYSFKDGILNVTIDSDKIDLGNNNQLIVNTNIDSKISENKNVQKVNLIAKNQTNASDNNTAIDEKNIVADDKNTVVDEQNTLVGTTTDENNNSNDIQIVNESDEYIDELNSHDKGILVLKDKVIMKDIIYGGLTEYDYSEMMQRYTVQNFEKADFEQFLDNNYAAIMTAMTIMIFIVDFVIYLLQLILDIVLLTILSFFISKIVRVKLDMKQCFNIAVHALTLPLLLNIIYLFVNAFTGFQIENFRWMYTTISYIYIIVSILMIKTDVINVQRELIKINKEEDVVKEEIEAEKQKEKEEQEKKQREEEDKKKEKESDSDDKKKKDNEKDDQKPATDGALFEKTNEE